MKALQASLAVHAAAQLGPPVESLGTLDRSDESVGWEEHLAWYPLIHLSASEGRHSRNVFPSMGAQFWTTKQFVEGGLMGVGVGVGVSRLELDGTSGVGVALVGVGVEESTEDG